MNSYRKVDEITALLDITIDSCLELSSNNLSNDEQKLIDRLNNWRSEFQLDSQILQIFEAPMSDLEFKDILRQVLKPILDDIFEKAEEDGVITPQEQRLLDKITKNFEV